MLIPTIECNLCGAQLIVRGSRIGDGFAIYASGPTGAEYSKLGLSNCHRDAQAHLCRSCLEGIATITPEAVLTAQRTGTWSPA